MEPDPTGLATVLGKPLDTGLDLLQRFAGPAADELGQYFTDKVRLYRFRNQLRTLEKANATAAAAGYSPRAVPIKLLFPLLHHAEGDALARIHRE